ncbi:MAG: 4'-phosphopantetheinyl transferase superfamily protein [Gammaproteobacteria bacterium]|nr:4'-phosphopantetheinyl transferase superfamily protein [Gammaproteobacteria bacterium]
MNSASLFPPQVVVQSATDEMWETPVLQAEERLIAQATGKRQREFRAGRHCAHTALRRLGLPKQAILRDENRAPLWPLGYLGSISHCRNLCIAACVKQDPILGLGLDVEPLEPLRPGTQAYIQTAAETAFLQTAETKLPERLVFSAKESLYKCYYPLLQAFFGFHSVELSIDVDRQAFDFRPTAQAQVNFPGHVQFYGRYLISQAHLVTGCYLLPAPG